MPRRQTPVFLPSINEVSEKNDERIQYIKKALQIEKDDVRENTELLRVRYARNTDANIGSVDKDPPAPTKRSKPPLLRTETNLDAWNRHGPNFVNGNQRARTGALNTRQKLHGFGQRKIASPRIDNDRQKLARNDVPDTIDLTKYEDVQAILQRFYLKDLKMESSDPRLSGSNDYRVIGELWHASAPGRSLLNTRRKSENITGQLSSTMDGEKVIVQLRKHQSEDSPGKILSEKLESFQHKPAFNVSYARPTTLKSLQTGTRKVLTSSFQEQPKDVNKYSTFRGQPKAPSKRRAKFLRPIKQKRKPPGITLLNNRTDI